jgi:hypothetical protein
MEWRDGKLHIDCEDEANLMRALSARTSDGESAAELRRVARACDAKAANPDHPVPVVRYIRTSDEALGDAFLSCLPDS